MAADASGDEPRPGSVAEGAPLWHGRFRVGPGPEMEAFANSLHVDRQLWSHDLDGTVAHVTMLGAQGLLAPEETELVLSALDQVRAEMASGEFRYEDGDEDIHSAIERRTTQLAGEAGAKLHTGRSRNDQVATALRLWSREWSGRLAEAVLNLVEVLETRAAELDAHEPPAVMPGYTHLQRAQTILASHHLRAHCWALLRDAERLGHVGRTLSVSPLGAGALGGSSLAVDPVATAAHLGFSQTFGNSMDAVADRDFVADLLHACAMVGIHLSRLGEEWVLWSSAEFGFVVLDDRYSTGSSMLPQKKNPDIAELARGKAGRLIGNLTGFLATLKGLSLAYNRDLQEDKEPLFDSVLQVHRALEAVAAMISTARFDTVRMRGAVSEDLAAIDLAEHLVAGGTPFREAHRLVGDLVARAVEAGTALSEVARDSGLFGDDLEMLMDPVSSVNRRRSPGGAGRASAEAQSEAIRAAIRAGRTEVAR